MSKGYLDPSDGNAKTLLKRSDDFYQRNEPFISPFWTESQIDTRFVSGDQVMMNMLYDSRTLSGQSFFINLMQRYIGMLTGFQRAHRKSWMMLPSQGDTDQICDDYNGVFKWCEDQSNFQEIFSDSCEGSFTVGSNLMHAYPNYDWNPLIPDIMWNNISSVWFMIDASFRKRDLSDCEGIYTRKWITNKRAARLLPSQEKEIAKIPAGWADDDKFPIQQSLINNKIENLIPYDEFSYLTTRTATVIYDKKTEQFVEWEEDESEIDDEMRILKQIMPWVVVKKMEVPTVNLGVIVGGRPLYDGRNLLSIDRYPYAINLCNYYPDSPFPRQRIQGFARVMRPLQFLYNLRKMAELSILQSQANTGWIFPVDVVTDTKAFRQTQDGIVIPLKSGKTPDMIRRIEPPAINPTIIELSRILKDDFSSVTGITDELLGANMKDNSGILEMFRQAAGLTTLQKVFDGCDFALRMCGEIQRDAIRKNFNRAKVKSILGRDPDPKFFSSNIQKYGVAVEEGSYSTTQRQMELQQYLHFRQIGMNVSDKTIWRAAFLTNKKRAMEEAEEVVRAQSQQQAAQNELESKEKEAMIIERTAKAQLIGAQTQQENIKTLKEALL